MPSIEIKVITCDGDEIIYKSVNIETINDVVQAVAGRNGTTITPLKKKGGD